MDIKSGYWYKRKSKVATSWLVDYVQGDTVYVVRYDYYNAHKINRAIKLENFIKNYTEDTVLNGGR